MATIIATQKRYKELDDDDNWNVIYTGKFKNIKRGFLEAIYGDRSFDMNRLKKQMKYHNSDFDDETRIYLYSY